MAEDSDGVVSFVGEQFRRLNVRFDRLEQRIDTREAKMEDRLANIKRRLSAQTQTEQALIGHLASIHSSIDNLRAEYVGIDRRIKALEVRA